MADQRSVLKEYRFLEEKRRTQGLSREEQARLDALREFVGDAAPARGFDVNAAAARLRESLLPAGLRRPPPTPEVLEPEPEPEPLPVAPPPADWAEQVPEAFAEPGEATDPFFDPASLAAEDADAGAWNANADPAAAGWDPVTGAWDPNVPYDPDAPAYDPNAAPYDPNAAPYDPNAAPYDPNAAAYDPNAAPYDPNAAAYDPNAPAWDPNAAAYDPDAAASQDPGAWDPNAPAYDSNATAWDPNAAAWDPNAPAWDPSAAANDPNAAPQDPAAWDPEAGFDPSSELSPLDLASVDPAQPAEPDAAAPALDDPGLESLLPFDPEAASAIRPDDLSGGFEGAAAWAEPPPAAPEPNAFETAPQLTPEASAEWHPETALEAGFELASHGSFDAPAAPAPQAFEAEPEAEAAPEPTQAFSIDLAEDAAPEPSESFALEAEATGAFALEAEPGRELTDAFSLEGMESAPEPTEAFSLEAAEPAPEPTDAFSLEAAEPAPEPTEAFPLDTTDSIPLEATEAFSLGPAPAPEQSVDIDLASEDQDLPTIDGEDILEEIPPEEVETADAERALDPIEVTARIPEAAVQPEPEPIPEPESEPMPEPEVAPEPPPAAPTRLDGSHRVVVHTVEGHVKRGVLEDADLIDAAIALHGQPGGGAESIPTDHVKTIFFMLAPGERPPPAEGQRVRVTFRDGRQVAGFSADYREDAKGFFMTPADTRTNTGRIWVYASAVKAVTVG